jgi:hypothetical protein
MKLMNSTIHNVALIATFLGAAISLACDPASTCASSICYQQEETKQKEENLQVACTALNAGEPAELLRIGDFPSLGKKPMGGCSGSLGSLLLLPNFECISGYLLKVPFSFGIELVEPFSFEFFG